MKENLDMDIRKRKGFTLIELLIAIAVIGILMSLLIPAVSKVMEAARRTKGANCLAQIAKAYNQYMNDDVNGRTISYGPIEESGWDDYAMSGKEWAIVLARRGYLNDPNMYSFSGDSLASRVVKKSIVENGEATATTSDAWNETGTNGLEFSVYVIAGIPSDAPLSTTPIAFTRGIPDTKDGKWANASSGSDNKKGVYGDKGGYIAYLDGHVEWYEDLGGRDTAVTASNPGKLIQWGGGGTTNNILETIPSTAYVLSADGGVIREGEGDSE